MTKWLLLCAGLVALATLTGCGGSDTIEPGEGSGTISETDFDPFGTRQGPMHLRYFTASHAGTYQVILSSGPEQPALASPWIRMLAGHVEETNESFFGAYDSGNGLLAANWGASIAQVLLTAEAGEEFTFCFASKSGGTGTYSWRVVEL